MYVYELIFQGICDHKWIVSITKIYRLQCRPSYTPIQIKDKVCSKIIHMYDIATIPQYSFHIIRYHIHTKLIIRGDSVI